MGRGGVELRTACKHCEAPLELTADDVMLLAPTSRLSPVTVTYECVSCGRGSALTVDRLIADLLEDEGAVTVRHHPVLRSRTMDADPVLLPASAPAARPAAPLSYDDLLTFHELLGRPDWFDELTIPGG